MFMSISKTLRSLAEANGIEVQKTSVYSSQKLRHSKLFSLLGIDLLVDVGANVGQFATLCRAHGYRGSILSFEPSSAAHRELLKTAAVDPLWAVADRMALVAATAAAGTNK